jgi:hypothetical protein
MQQLVRKGCEGIQYEINHQVAIGPLREYFQNSLFTTWPISFNKSKDQFYA